MYAIIKIEYGEPKGWMLAKTMQELKDRLIGETCFDDAIQKSRKDLADNLPDDGDVIRTPLEHKGYWLLK